MNILHIFFNFLQYTIIFVGKSSTLQRYNIFNCCLAFLTLSVAYCANIVLLLLFCTKITGSWHYQNYSILSKIFFWWQYWQLFFWNKNTQRYAWYKKNKNQGFVLRQLVSIGCQFRIIFCSCPNKCNDVALVGRTKWLFFTRVRNPPCRGRGLRFKEWRFKV